MKNVLTLIFGFFICGLLHAQDFGEEKEPEPEVEEEEVYTDPYKLTIRIRPLSYLLVIPTAGGMGSFNGRIDYAFSRVFTAGVEGNFFYQNPSPFVGTVTRSIMLSGRLDLNYFFLKNAGPSSYAEGLHIGPYLKAKYENSFNPDAFIPRYGQAEVTCLVLAGGPLIGYQWVFNKVVIDQSFGVGVGPYINDVELGVALDARMGLSFGLVAR